MLITVAVVFTPAALGFLWVVKRDGRRKRRDMESRHVTPAGGNIFLDLGFPPDEAAKLHAEAKKIIAEKLAKIAQEDK